MNPGTRNRVAQSHGTGLLRGLSIGRIMRFWVAMSLIPAVVSTAGVSGPRSGQLGIRNLLPELTVPFVANTGQLDSTVRYYARTFAGTAFVTRTGALVLSLPARPGSAKSSGVTGWTLVETPQGRATRPVGEEPATTRVSSFSGRNSAAWRTALPSYREISIGSPWPGVKLAYRARGSAVERLFTVAPGGDAGAIRMKVEGAERLRLSDGRLIVDTGVGEVEFSRPLAYQYVHGARRDVAVSYTTRGSSYGFRLGAYDQTRDVVIDPIIRTTYLGGALYDDVYSIARAQDGTIYVAGATTSNYFPGVSGGAQSSLGGMNDAFVARFSSDLKRLLQATYLGGSGIDTAFSIAVRSRDHVVYVAGRTSSLDFPGTAHGAQPTYGGGDYDAFVAVLNSKLTQLLNATYLGGSEHDADWSLELSKSDGSVYVGGSTSSLDFPVTPGCAQPNYGGGEQDAFVAELSPNLKRIIAATYLGGSGKEVGYGVVLTPSGLYFDGGTTSSDFPGTAGSAQSRLGGDEDAFVARFTPDLKTLVRATYFGGSANDESQVIAWDPNNQLIYIFGYTSSADLPDTAGGAQATYGGGSADAFAAAVDYRLGTIPQATYLGGSAQDQGRAALGVNPVNGDIYVGGMTRSVDFPFMAGGAQSYCRDQGRQGTVCGKGDAFLVRLRPDLQQAVQGTYIGGSKHEGGHALTFDPATGNVYFVFGTHSNDLLYTSDTAQPNFAGGPRDVTVSLLTPDLQAAP